MPLPASKQPRGEGMKKETDIMIDKVAMVQSDMDKKYHDLFLNKEILAPILQETVEEYKDLTVNEIIELIDEDSISKAEAVSDFPLPDKVVKEVDSMSGVGALMVEKEGEEIFTFFFSRFFDFA